MGWIDVSDSLKIYTIGDDVLKIIDFTIQYLKQLSPIYYSLIILGTSIVMLILLMFRLGIFMKDTLNPEERRRGRV